MVKKTIIAVAMVVLLVAVFVGAAQKWGYTRYGAIYYYGTPYSYAPNYVYPYGSNPYQEYGSYGYPAYAYPYMYRYGQTYPSYAYPYSYQQGPLSSENIYRYGAPTVSYPSYTSPETPRGKVGQPCGLIDSQTYGCEYGMTCDYTKTGVTGVGLCSRLPPVTTYPYQVGPSTTYPYYYT